MVVYAGNSKVNSCHKKTTNLKGAPPGTLPKQQRAKKPKKTTNHEETTFDDIMNLCHLKKPVTPEQRTELEDDMISFFLQVPWQMLKVCLAVTLGFVFLWQLDHTWKNSIAPKNMVSNSHDQIYQHIENSFTSGFNTSHNLGGGNSNIFYLHPEPWGRFPI